jgi:hypothetical protein
LLVKIDPSIVSRPRITITWIYESDAELFTLICVKRHLEQWFEDNCFELDLPYVPHARMDRVKKMTDVFTLKYLYSIYYFINNDFSSGYKCKAFSSVFQIYTTYFSPLRGY